ncbi:MAG TPA: hypothetical protein VK928_01775 [Longimicrobiales bacterium]|nr:hypothetical protein [Longimicrobiales bacterium]
MKGLKLVVVTAALGLAACGGATTEPDVDVGTQHSVQPGADVRLRLNDVATVRGTNVRVKFVGVPADSRCPIDALCVWQGDAEVKLEVMQTRDDVRRETLHTGVEPRSLVVEDYRVELLEVAPATTSTDSIRQREYSVRLRIARN